MLQMNNNKSMFHIPFINIENKQPINIQFIAKLHKYIIL